ncbi:membrane protein [Roseibium aquae]|uniref:Membrane protein n=1 Tax=Roseibium aquae TaxID=1323746 RepID=A0A916TMK1_9HYPH|nr:membrane protein [Roseibium aquae]
MIGFDQTGFDAHDLLLAPPGDGRVETVEGPRTRLIYLIPGDRSPLEVMRNYQAELSNQGFEVVFSCSRAACGSADRMNEALYPSGSRLKNYGQITEYALQFPRDDHQYLAARNPVTGRSITIWVAYDTFNIDERSANSTMALVDVVDGEGLEQRMEVVESVTRDDLSAAYDDQGRITLNGVFFATDSDTMTAESGAALTEIAAFLTARPEAKAYVVGHTDATGDFDYNLDLSRRRATSVVAALTGQFGIAPDRLAPAGVGPLVPVATNQTEEGRALNRRVELVRR